MRIYEIIDEENTQSIGVLLYYEKEKSFISTFLCTATHQIVLSG